MNDLKETRHDPPFQKHQIRGLSNGGRNPIDDPGWGDELALGGQPFIRLRLLPAWLPNERIQRVDRNIERLAQIRSERCLPRARVPGDVDANRGARQTAQWIGEDVRSQGRPPVMPPALRTEEGS